NSASIISKGARIPGGSIMSCSRLLRTPSSSGSGNAAVPTSRSRFPAFEPSCRKSSPRCCWRNNRTISNAAKNCGKLTYGSNKVVIEVMIALIEEFDAMIHHKFCQGWLGAAVPGAVTLLNHRNHWFSKPVRGSNFREYGSGLECRLGEQANKHVSVLYRTLDLHQKGPDALDCLFIHVYGKTTSSQLVNN